MSDTNGAASERDGGGGSRRATRAGRATPSPARRRRRARPSPTAVTPSSCGHRRRHGQEGAGGRRGRREAGLRLRRRQGPTRRPTPDHARRPRTGRPPAAASPPPRDMHRAVRGVPGAAAVRHRGPRRARRCRNTLQAAFAQGVRPAGRVGREGPQARAGGARPLPRPQGRLGAVIGQAGHLAGVEELFEACPAWMPDLTAPTRLPHAYARRAALHASIPARRAGRRTVGPRRVRADHR